MKMLCIGEEWKGSNASGLFNAFSRIGCITLIINELRYVPTSNKNFIVKLINKILRRFYVEDFNSQILSVLNSFQPDLILVYKGTFINPATIVRIKQKQIKIINFFPDVSFFSHGSLIPKTLKHYDWIFSTKSFAKNDLKEKFGISNVSFIPHGFDPNIHRMLNPSDNDIAIFECDISFIGTWSPKKEEILSSIILNIPTVNLKIWGGQWERATSSNLKSYIMNVPIHGDLYALAINCSRINLALLSEIVVGASSGDLITSRTFHIPGAGGFMLHERTEEVKKYFDEDVEAVYFSNINELVNKINYYLENQEERTFIAQNGFLKAKQNHSLDNRAHEILHNIKLYV